MNKFFNSKNGQIIISIIWGLGLAALFRKVCEGRNCIVIKAEKPKKIKDKIFKYENSCYKYYPEAINCDKNSGKEMVEFFKYQKLSTNHALLEEE